MNRKQRNKSEYFRDGVRYCHEIENEITAPTLFDLMEAPALPLTEAVA